MMIFLTSFGQTLGDDKAVRPLLVVKLFKMESTEVAGPIVFKSTCTKVSKVVKITVLLGPW